MKKHITSSKEPKEHCVRCVTNITKKTYKGCSCKCHINLLEKKVCNQCLKCKVNYGCSYLLCNCHGN